MAFPIPLEQPRLSRTGLLLLNRRRQGRLLDWLRGEAEPRRAGRSPGAGSQSAADNLLGELVAEPVKAFVEAVALCRARGLDVPLVVAAAVVDRSGPGV